MSVPQVVLVARNSTIADLVTACAKGELPFSGLWSKITAMGYSGRSLYEMVIAEEARLMGRAAYEAGLAAAPREPQTLSPAPRGEEGPKTQAWSFDSLLLLIDTHLEGCDLENTIRANRLLHAARVNIRAMLAAAPKAP